MFNLLSGAILTGRHLPEGSCFVVPASIVWCFAHVFCRVEQGSLVDFEVGVSISRHFNLHWGMLFDIWVHWGYFAFFFRDVYVLSFMQPCFASPAFRSLVLSRVDALVKPAGKPGSEHVQIWRYFLPRYAGSILILRRLHSKFVCSRMLYWLEVFVLSCLLDVERVG